MGSSGARPPSVKNDEEKGGQGGNPNVLLEAEERRREGVPREGRPIKAVGPTDGRCAKQAA